MTDSGWSESLVLAEWANRECRHLDVIHSWENLMSVYVALGFTGPDNDEARLSEFKTVISEMNKFLTRMRNGLAKADGIEAAIEYLGAHVNTANMNDVRTRPSVAYNKLKQRWILQSIATLDEIARAHGRKEGERDAD